MKNNALYFPYINIPHKRWTLKTLLYWDRLYSIVPAYFIEHPENLDPFMRDLVENELVVQLFPGQYIYSVDSFAETFIEYVERYCLIEPYYVASNDYARIHLEKLEPIAHELCQRRLAFPHENQWYFVKKPIAKAYMAYLAGVLSQFPDVSAIPVTDNVSVLKILGAGSPCSNHALRRSIEESQLAARVFILDKLLPFPEANIKIGELISFKSRYGKLLPRFRRLIENKCIEVAQIRDPGMKIRALEIFAETADEEAEEILDAMKSRWTRILFGSLLPVIAAGGAAYYSDGSGKAVAGTALIGAVYKATLSIRGESADIEKRPFAYVAHARRELLK